MVKIRFLNAAHDRATYVTHTVGEECEHVTHLQWETISPLKVAGSSVCVVYCSRNYTKRQKIVTNPPLFPRRYADVCGNGNQGLNALAGKHTQRCTGLGLHSKIRKVYQRHVVVCWRLVFSRA